VSQAGLVARLAVRELWMTFRLLAVLVAFIGGSAIVVLVPAAPAVTLDRLALALGLASVVASGVAAWSLAAERTAGRSGWLITRSVSRRTYLAGWFAGLALVAAAGVTGAGLLGFLAVYSLPVGIGPVTFGATILAVAAAAAAAVAVGLAVGALLRPIPAALVAMLACAAAGLAASSVPESASLIPGGAFGMLGDLVGSATGLADAIRAGGAGLLATAGMLVLAGRAMERAEL
jgi:hypothetical protein